MDDVQQVMVVHGVDLDEHIIVTCSVMTLHHLGNLQQGLYNTIELFRIFQVQTDIGASFITNLFRVDNELRSFQYT